MQSTKSFKKLKRLSAFSQKISLTYWRSSHWVE